jgi:hypothetical protein
LDRQIELLDYLTSGAAIFGDSRGHSRCPDGFDRRLLDLEARLSHGKRLAKINSIFARTFKILGDATSVLVREFTDACRPDSIGGLDNARQFYGFLTARYNLEPAQPPYLLDVAACELALAEVRAAGARPMARRQEPREPAPNKTFRRPPGVILLRCAHAIQPIFEREADGLTPERRDTPLAIAMQVDRDQPSVQEIPAAVFELLASLDDFTDLTAFGTTSELQRLTGALLEYGLIEGRP